MALRSVVVDAPAAPPAPRRTVVVRAGGPAPKGRALDVVVGVLGALMLVIAIALAQVLPDRTYLNPQFRLTFAETPGEGPGSRQADYVEGTAEVMEFPYTMDVDNIFSVTLELGFPGDNVSYSLPDRFDVDLFAPNGTQMGHLELENAPPRPSSSETDSPTLAGIDAISVFPIVPLPADEIVTALTATETPEQVLARLAPQHHVATKGDWIVRVTLVAAGDCPDPGQGYPAQSFHCRFGHPSGAGEAAPNPATGDDAGNQFFVANFQYSFFEPTIQELN